MTSNKTDVVVIGAGPAGYVAAIRCAQLGLKTLCVDSWLNESGQASPGGTCLNVGCIPSKTLLDSSHAYQHIKTETKEHGITVEGVSIDVSAMQERKRRVVTLLTKGIEGLFRKNRVEFVQGLGKLVGDKQVTITSSTSAATETMRVDAEHVIIATGSEPAALPQIPIDGNAIVDSSGALAFEEVPKRLGVIGAGVIGLELGSVWNRLGAQVTLLEAMDTFLPLVDQEIAKDALRNLKRQDLDIQLNCRVTGTQASETGVQVNYKYANGATQQLEVDKLVVAVGRRPYTHDLGAETVGLKLDARGFIEVDEQCKTNLPGVYAIGDVVRGPMLAHKGSEEGVAVAERIAGQQGHINYETIPWVIYTWPEVAWVGKSEEQLKGLGADYRVGVFPFMGIGRARAMGETTGKVKIIGDKKTDRILGVHIFGPNASELIAEAVTAMECDASTEDLARTVHAHPTLAEALHEAALAVDKRAIHI